MSRPDRPEPDAFEGGETVRPGPEELHSTIRDLARGRHTLPDDGPPSAVPSADAFAHYEIAGQIGRGGMAEVFRARQVRLGREVALKKILPDRPVARSKFLAEARVTGALEHPGIVPVYDLLVADGGDVALAMKLVRGTSWKDLLHPADGAPARDLDFHLGVLVSVANAVAFSHSKCIAHNDLKPANVMVGEFGEVLVVDWGMALDFRDEPSDEAVAPHRSLLHSPGGTPAYWAPELARGKGSEIGPWTDVYLLGAILYEIATGQPPHRGESLLTAIMEAVKSDPPPFEPGLPAGIEAICRRAMAPMPKDRYPSATAFRDAVAELQKHRESMLITASATATLARATQAATALPPGSDDARRIRIYADHADAGSAFRQARVLWPDNPDAAAGERSAALSMAHLALRNGDLGLAEVEVARLDPEDPDAKRVSAEIAAATTERARNRRRVLWMRRGLVSAVAAIVVGLSAGIVTIRAEHRRTEAAAALARARLTEVMRLPDVKRLADFTAEADELWPARLDKLPALQAWTVKARALAARADQHRAMLAELRRRAVRSGDVYRFADAEDQWEHDTLAALVAGLDDLEKRLIPDVERRVELARTLRARSIEAPAVAEAWRKAIASIADPAECPRYHGLRIVPQLGLVPLGRDAASGLWEFAHLESGEAPARDAAGKLVLTEATGIVLVLLPGGTFTMGTRRPDAEHPPGSPNVDPDARTAEGPVHAVTLDPFFFGKYEITQGQWLRATGTNPSAYPAGQVIGKRVHTLLHPVEQIGWKEVSPMLHRMELRLPTEAQWEYAARGGTETVYALGDARETLQGYANLADRYCKENGGPGSWSFETWLDDGYVVHAPVGSYRPNGFGLHDTAGNVWEFVEDRYGGYELPVSPGDGERQAPESAPRVFRGGGFRSNAVHARAGDRYGLYAPDFRGFDIGARAARGVDR